MQLRVRPEDFRVEEQYQLPARRDGGEYAYYRMTKRKLTTMDAARRVADHLGVSQRDVGYLGLKDKQALTTQLISVRNPRRTTPMRYGELKLAYLGRGARAVEPQDLAGNRFRITVRGMRKRDADAARHAAGEVEAAGLPNYFDDQRFGGLKHGQGWVWLRVLRGDLEGALFALTARPSRHDHGGDAEAKRNIARAWGNWAQCARLGRGSSVAGAMHAMAKSGGDFVAGLRAVPLSVRLLHTFAFQSFLWNEALTRYLDARFPKHPWLVLRYAAGRLLLWRTLPPEDVAAMERLEMPLVDARTRIADAAVARAVDTTLARLELTRAQLAVHGAPAGFVLGWELRPVVLRPRRLTFHEPFSDPETKGLLAAEVTFTLPRGAYASLVLHRLFPAMRRPDAADG